MAKFVVTGCAGFIGSTLTDALLGQGCEVIGVDCFTDYYAREQKQSALAAALDSERFTFHDADLIGAPLMEYFSGADGIFHLAAQPGVRGSWGDSFDIYAQNNVVVTQRICECALALNVRVVFASSSSIYGNAEVYPTREDTTPQPISPYGVTKLSCEALTGAYERSAGLDVTALRYFTVYGPRQRPDMAFARIVDSLLKGETFQVFGDGGQSRDFTFVSDAVAATIAAMQSARSGRIYNVGGGSEASLREVIQILENLSGRKLDAAFEASAKGDPRRTYADTSAIRSELGWEPQISLRDGLRAQLQAAQGE
jgi:nucleoside-diphosphate-sugar epimerase